MLLLFFLVVASMIAGVTELGGATSTFHSLEVTLSGTACMMIGVWGVGFAFVQGIVRAMSGQRLRLAALLRAGYILSLLVAYATILTSFGWAGMIDAIAVGRLNLGEASGLLTLGEIPVLGYLGRLLPALVLIAIGLHPLYHLDRLSRPALRVGGYYNFYLRMVLAPLPLLILFLVIQDGVGWAADTWPAVDRFLFRFPSAQVLMLLVMVAVAATFFPVVLRLVFRSRRLPAGPVRARLARLASEAGVKFRDIVVWRTGSFRLPNAMVTGVWPWLRYVFITDVVLERMHPLELDAVFAHELGHARHNHLAIFMGSVAGFLCLTFGLLDPGLVNLGFALSLPSSEIQMLNGIVQLTLVGAFFLSLLGGLNPRFERQADLYAQAHSVPGAIESALLRIDRLVGGTARKRPSLTHGSIESRINFLARVRALPAIGQRVLQRTNRLIRIVVIAVVIGLLAPLPTGIIEITRGATTGEVFDIVAPIYDDDGFTPDELNTAIAELDALREQAPDNSETHFWAAILREEQTPATRASLEAAAEAYRDTIATGAANPARRLSALERLEIVERKLARNELKLD